MQAEELTTLITQLAPEQKPGVSKQYPEFILPAEKLTDVVRTLKEGHDTHFDYLFCLTAVDRKDGFHVVYHLTSSRHKHTVVLRLVLPDKVNPVAPSIAAIFPAAEFYEREVFDMFGIRFENHPDLRRLFLDDDWVGYPLRKDYKDSFTFER